MKIFVEQITRRIALVIVCALLYMAVVCGHELGHWIAAQAVGFHPSVFSIGQGKPYVSLGQVRSTEFRLTPWLIGGGVHIEELRAEVSAQTEPAFVLRQMIVLLAGPVASCLMGVGFAYVLFPAAGFRGALTYCRRFSFEILRALAALLTFRNLNSLREDFDYYTFLELPWMASGSMHNVFRAFCSTALSEGIFNLFPIPILDGGKIAFCVVWLITRTSTNPSVEMILLILSWFGLAILFFAALYRGYRYPFPK
jgi:membrane-associated protease RseP (regulator of RpoE activity)